VSLAADIADLATTGTEVIRLAFRLGIHVDQVSQNLEPRSGTGPPDSWACVISDGTEAEVQSELDAAQAKDVRIGGSRAADVAREQQKMLT
jgi:hypothetical protein